jgi:hypothetical protein
MERNPNHPVTRSMHDNWHKLCAIVMLKLGKTSIDITSADIEALSISGRANIVCREHGETITLSLVTDDEAVELAKREGGLPV